MHTNKIAESWYLQGMPLADCCEKSEKEGASAGSFKIYAVASCLSRSTAHWKPIRLLFINFSNSLLFLESLYPSLLSLLLTEHSKIVIPHRKNYQFLEIQSQTSRRGDWHDDTILLPPPVAKRTPNLRNQWQAHRTNQVYACHKHTNSVQRKLSQRLPLRRERKKFVRQALRSIIFKMKARSWPLRIVHWEHNARKRWHIWCTQHYASRE